MSAETAKQGTVLELSYRVRLRDGASPAEAVKELKQLGGVQSVDLRQSETVEA